MSGTPERNACSKLLSRINCNLYRVLRCKRVIIVVVYRLLVLGLTSYSLNTRLAYSFIHLAVDTGRPQDITKLGFLSMLTLLKVLNFIKENAFLTDNFPHCPNQNTFHSKSTLSIHDLIFA